ncbi:hypothetical protein PVAND_013401 [Polypedilum vanderplanki]|uniref:Ankyrin repeat domain-containing protein n=1 Tax=Polypedilum vanderplanki TaxID=319348 RepID=A0A9J6CQD3_POLVA|nr:hypothetical protein PVAND_013401 [Polypedilum vanderplanki]
MNISNSTQPIQKDKFFYNEAETQVTVNCKTLADWLSLITEKSFIENFDSHKKANVIILNVESELKNVETLRENEFSSKSWILVAFLSTTNERQMIIIWRNHNSNAFQKLDFDEKFSKEFLSFVLDFIIEILEKENELFGAQSLSNLTNFFLTCLQNSCGLNLLMKAIKENKKEIFDELLELPYTFHEKCILNENDDDATAADLAWEMRNHEILFKLLQNNSPFPAKFEKIQELEQTSIEIKLLMKDLNEMHEAINKMNFEDIEKYLVKYSNLIYFYNITNNSAIRIAAEKDDKRIYDLLLKSGCKIGPFEDYKIILKYLQNDPSYINELEKEDMKYEITTGISTKDYLSFHDKYSFSYGKLKEKRKLEAKRRKLFEIVNESDDGKLILKITSTINYKQNEFQTHFDFDSQYIAVIYKRKNKNANKEDYEACTGLINLQNYKIFVGAQKFNKRKNEIASILKHEHCHLALLKTFMNGCKPYVEGNVSKDDFDKVVEECQNKKGEEIIIDRVFDCYPDEIKHAELAVRASEMITFYKDNQNKLTEQKEKFPLLFDYLEKKIKPAMDEFLNKVTSKLSNDSNKFKVEELPISMQAICKNQEGKTLKKISSEKFCSLFEAKAHEQIINWAKFSQSFGAK